MTVEYLSSLAPPTIGSTQDTALERIIRGQETQEHSNANLIVALITSLHVIILVTD